VEEVFVGWGQASKQDGPERATACKRLLSEQFLLTRLMTFSTFQ
jgi:hypothetical protein